MMRQRIPLTADTDCPVCGTTHVGARLVRDEDSAYYEFDTTPCGADGCKVRLCSACPQFECSECGLTHCLTHRVLYSGRAVCPVCMASLTATDAEVAA
jgi:hypothetical protein